MSRTFSALTLAVFAALSARAWGAAPTSDDTKVEATQPTNSPKMPRKPMVMHEIMPGEMKKEGMMKEEVMKGAMEKDKFMMEVLKKEESMLKENQ